MLKAGAAGDMVRLTMKNASSVEHDALTCMSHITSKSTKEVDAENFMEEAPQYPGAGRGGLGSRSSGRKKTCTAVGLQE